MHRRRVSKACQNFLEIKGLCFSLALRTAWTNWVVTLEWSRSWRSGSPEMAIKDIQGTRKRATLDGQLKQGDHHCNPWPAKKVIKKDIFPSLPASEVSDPKLKLVTQNQLRLPLWQSSWIFQQFEAFSRLAHCGLCNPCDLCFLGPRGPLRTPSFVRPFARSPAPKI